MHSARRRARGALWIVLLAGLLGWVAFALARYSDVVIDTAFTWEEMWGDEAIGIVRPSIYLTVAALAVLGIGALLAKRALTKPVPSALAHPVRDFAGTVIIITLVLSAISALGIFMNTFFDTPDRAGIATRVLASYLPIVLFTALVVTLLLAGFVFVHRTGSPAAAAAALPGEAPVTADDSPAVQRSTALAFTVPIIAVAIALIIGLIVFDLTRTVLEAWIWVIVLAIVAAGIVAGTRFAARATRTVRSGVALGARVLNFVLSIIFAAVVAAMSLGYTASAMDQLRFAPMLTITAYANAPTTSDAESGTPVTDVSVMIDGSDLRPGSSASVTWEPSGEDVSSAAVDGTGYAWAEFPLPAGLPDGTGELVVTATSADGSELRLGIDLVIESGSAEFADEPMASLDDSAARVLPASPGWILTQLLPAFALVLLVIASLSLTLTGRNPQPESSGSRRATRSP